MRINNAKEYNAIDILKLVLSVFVMIIHSGVNKTVISPLLRIAVPLFFIISSYFFFSKTAKLQSEKEKNKALLKLVKRNLLLYLFWSMIQLPLVFFMRGYRRLGMLGVWQILKDIMLGSGFTGSWYIAALIVGIIAVFWLSKKISSVWLAFLTLPLYIVSCLITNYYNLFDASSIVLKIENGFHELTGLHFYTSLPVALFWIAVGRVVAEKKFTVKIGMLLPVGAVLTVLFAVERYLIVRYGMSITDDCYFMLALICPVIFLLVRKIKPTFTTRFPVREFSVLLYVTHGCSGRIIGYLVKLMPIQIGSVDIFKMVGTLLVTAAITAVAVRLKERTYIGIFKYIC